MNRVQWAAWILSWFFNAEVREAAHSRLVELESAIMKKTEKRQIVEAILFPAMKSGGIFIARALIELWLEQQRAKLPQ